MLLGLVMWLWHLTYVYVSVYVEPFAHHDGCPFSDQGERETKTALWIHFVILVYGKITSVAMKIILDA